MTTEGAAGPAARPAVPARGWGLVAAVLFAVAMGTNVPTPLLLLYRERLGLSEELLTTLFGSYALGVLAALFLSGPASDRYGRRRVVLPSAVLVAGASALFTVAGSLPLLFAARVLQGITSGAVFGVASAWLVDVSDPGAPRRAARRASTAMTAGFALGPLSSGLLAQWAPAPLVTPYLVHIAAMAVGIAAAARAPDPRRGTPARPGPLLQLGIPAGAGAAFARLVVPVGVCVYAFPAVAVTVLPLLLGADTGGVELAVAGVVGGVTLSSGAAVQPLTRRLSASRTAVAGALAGSLGLALGVVAVQTGAWPLLLPVALLMGGGGGLALNAGLTFTERLTTAATRGAATSTFYACAYLGFAAPLLVAAVADRVGFAASLAGLSAVAAAATVWIAVTARHVP